MRSSGSEQAKRVNAAISLMKTRAHRGDAIGVMMRRFRISRRQAYRYVQRAEGAQTPVPIPEQKVVFTVKLPKGLAERLRRLADGSGQTLSAVVTQALEAFLRTGRKHGRGQPTEAG